MLKYGHAMSTTALTVPAAGPFAPLQDALRHEAQAAYDARRLALLQKQHDELLAKEGAEAQQAARPADEQTAASSAALAQQQGLVQSLRAEARGAATELEQLRVGRWDGWVVEQAPPGMPGSWCSVARHSACSASCMSISCR